MTGPKPEPDEVVTLLPGVSSSTWTGWGLCAVPFWISGVALGLANRSSGNWNAMTVALVLGFGGAAFMAVFRMLAWHRAKREVAAGYTTTFKQRGVPRVDPRSGLVLYGADDPDPESAEWRVIKQRAREYRRSVRERESVDDTDNHDRH